MEGKKGRQVPESPTSENIRLRFEMNLNPAASRYKISSCEIDDDKTLFDDGNVSPDCAE